MKTKPAEFCFAITEDFILQPNASITCQNLLDLHEQSYVMDSGNPCLISHSLKNDLIYLNAGVHR